MNRVPVPPPNWWNRNWKWVVPVVLATGIVLFAAFCMAIVGFVFGAMKSSEPYQTGLSRARAHPAVTAALGEPIAPGYLMSGSINTNGASGAADLAIPLEGSRGAATLYVVANRQAGEWHYETLVVALDEGGRRIDLQGGNAGIEAGE